MKEELVSLETAKLLKEKGCELASYTYYDLETGKRMGGSADMYGYQQFSHGFGIYAPTQSIAAKWLREKHDINISVLKMTSNYGGAVSKDNMLRYFWHIQIPNRESIVDVQVYYDTYEEAMEAGLKNALKLV